MWLHVCVWFLRVNRRSHCIDVRVDEVFGTYRMLMVQGLLDLATDVRPITDVATKSIRQFSAMTRCVGGRFSRAVSSRYCS